jgi:hypothetical protein
VCCGIAHAALRELGEEIIIITAAERFLQVIKSADFEDGKTHHLASPATVPRRARLSRRWFHSPVAGLRVSGAPPARCAPAVAQAIELPQCEAGETESPAASGLRAEQPMQEGRGGAANPAEPAHDAAVASRSD